MKHIPSCGDLCKITLGNKIIPMVSERGLRDVVILQCPKGPFVNDSVIASILKEGGGNPRLCI